MSLYIKRIKALCFDIDGTLKDTDDEYVEKLENLLSPLKIILSKNKIASLSRWVIMKAESPGNLLYSIPDRLGIDDKLFNNLKTKDLSHSKHKLVSGIVQSLNQLNQKFPMAVVSARIENQVVAFLEHHELNNFFPHVISALSSKRSKPHPDPMLLAAQQLGMKPENLLMIGDTTYDILCGKRAGAQTVGVLSGFGEEKELIKAGADLILNSVADLPKILLLEE